MMTPGALILAAAASAAATSAGAGGYAFRPFVTAPPIWDYWWVLLLPLCAGVAVVYKSAKCYRVGEVPREAAVLTTWIVAAMVAAAAVLYAVVELR